ncbi:hypothetical protein KIL84_002008 [Mauremys mutica]|uniref:Uncharacterized protein n=1 Tax=Mauremys mutica TaxID=74926 RepID=A0A9D3XGG2_9SAUR|nr:hypothetical protein KIL84_002008 [Mauremys mutica]
MILFLCLFLPALSPSSQDTCSAPGSTRSSGGGAEPTHTGLDLKLKLLGITIPSVVVVLAVVLYLLGKKVVSLLRNQRKRVQLSTSNTPEVHIEYASMKWLRCSRHPPAQRQETSIYANIAVQQDRCN